MRLSLILLTAIAAPAFAQGVGQCSFPLGGDSGTISLRSLAGVYALEWHSLSKRGDRRPPHGQLWLWPAAPTDSALGHPAFRPDPSDTLVYPLFGTVTPSHLPPAANDSLRRVTDPIDPPILLLARHREDPPALLFGTATTRRAGVYVLDGPGIGVWLTHLSPRTLAGTFEAWGIAEEDPGYLCLRRIR